MALKDRIEQARNKMVQQGGRALDSLAAIANALDMRATAATVKEIGERLASDNFNLIVLGRFNNGKSTMLNALLGKPTAPVADWDGSRGIMPTDDLPCTATLTKIRYAEQPYVRVSRLDGKREEWSLAKYLRESSVRTSHDETANIFKDISGFELGFPAELCKSGVTLIDSPGMDDVPLRTAITRSAVPECDAAIVIYRSDSCAGQGEREFVSEMIATSNTRVFTLVNMWSGRKLDDRYKAFVWDRLIAFDRGGEPYSGQDFASRDVYFVDGLKALQGKLAGDMELVAESGLAAFEQRLGDFLVNERHSTHIVKFVSEADKCAVAIEQKASQHRNAILADGQKLVQAYEAIQPQLAAVRARRDELPALFERYRNETEREVMASFEQMIAKLRQDLPDELAARQLPTAATLQGKVLGMFQQKKLCTEALGVCEEIVNERITTWGGPEGGPNGACAVMNTVLQRMFEDVKGEIAEIDRAFSEANFEMTGWTVNSAAPTSVISTQERVLSGIAGLLVGDFSVLTGGVGGWRSVAGALGGHLAGAFVLGAIGLAGTAVFWPICLVIGVASSLLAGSVNLDERAKKTVQDQVLAELTKLPQEARLLLKNRLDTVFCQVEEQTMRSVHSVVRSEEHTSEL